MEYYKQELDWINSRANELEKIESMASSASLTNSNNSYVRSAGTNYREFFTKLFRQKYYKGVPSNFFTVNSNLLGAYADDYQVTSIEAQGNESGLVSNSASPTFLPQISLSMSDKVYPLVNWRYGISYDIHDLQRANSGKNFSINVIQEKERATFQKFQTAVELIAFLGSDLNGGYEGLLTQSDVVVDATTFNNFLHTLTLDQLEAKLIQIITNVKNSLNNVPDSMPNTFVIPSSEMTGLKGARLGNENSVFNTKFDFVEHVFRKVFGNDSFSIKELPYCDKANNASVLGGVGKNRSILYRNDPESINMHITRNYATTAFGTSDNFNFSCVAHAAFGGVNVTRPYEMRYFDHTA